MKIHVLHHVHLPIKHGITRYLEESLHEVSHTYVFETPPFPAISDIDWLIVMGGPMSANDEATRAWLVPEKQFIKDVIDAGKTVLGICLGAQLIAHALGAAVTKNPYPEFGWHQLTPSAEVHKTLLGDVFKQEQTLFHSHSETFGIPTNAIRIASSQACENQGFIYDNRVIAIQFHPEITPELAALFTTHCDEHWAATPYCKIERPNKRTDELFNSSASFIKTLLGKIERSIAQY